MFYVVELKKDEAIVRNIFVGKDDANNQCQKLSAKWPHAYFDVFNEAAMDSTSFTVKC